MISKDGGGIRGLSELLIIKQLMHKLMVDLNMKRKQDGQPPLTSLPRPCDWFDLIGGTSTGGYTLSFKLFFFFSKKADLFVTA